jgi:WD40 repeat protein
MEDGTVRLFDSSTGEELLVLRGHDRGGFGFLSFSPDGSMLASSDSFGPVRVWALDLDRLLEIARDEVTRSLTDEECRQYLHVDSCSVDASTVS